MGWAIGYDSNWGRDVGYGVPATCDHPGCNKSIDRGLSYVCGGEPYGGDRGCGLHFCHEHFGEGQLCDRCLAEQEPYEPKPDCDEWLAWKLSHYSWQRWRDENPEETAKILAHFGGAAPAIEDECDLASVLEFSIGYSVGETC